MWPFPADDVLGARVARQQLARHHLLQAVSWLQDWLPGLHAMYRLTQCVSHQITETSWKHFENMTRSNFGALAIKKRACALIGGGLNQRTQ